MNGAALSKSRVDLSDDLGSNFVAERIEVSAGEQLIILIQLNVALVRRRQRREGGNEVERYYTALGSDDDHTPGHCPVGSCPVERRGARALRRPRS